MGRVCFSSCAVQQESPVSGPSSNCCWYLYSQESLATAPILSQQVILLSCLFVLWASPDASTPCPMRQRAPAGITPSCVSACSKWPCSDLPRRCCEHSAFVPPCGSTGLAIRHLFGTKMVCTPPWTIMRHRVCRGIRCGCCMGAVISRIHHPPGIRMCSGQAVGTVRGGASVSDDVLVLFSAPYTIPVQVR